MGRRQTCRNIARPSWLQVTLSELEQRFQSLSLQYPEREVSDSFADRAENYYRTRPQLISLVQDLHHRYLSLADRYSQLLLKLHRKSSIFTVHYDHEDGDTVFTDATADLDPDPPDSSDAESSLSFQTQTPPPSKQETDERKKNSDGADVIVTGIVTGEIENAILRHEVGILEKQQSESSRKMELQRSLLEVLESERMVLLSENTRLGFRASAAVEENEGLTAEVGFMRRKAGELARCVVKLREEHRVCMLGRKIEDLQAQIYGLEKRNKECYEVMARREEEKAEIVRELCVELQRVKAENRRLREDVRKRKRRWWGGKVVRKMEMLVFCGSRMGKKIEEEEMNSD